MNLRTTGFSRLASGLFAGLLFTYSNVGAGELNVVPTAPFESSNAVNDVDARARRKQKQRDAVQAFRDQAGTFLREYYDFHLGLIDDSPNHSVLRDLLLELKKSLEGTFVHPGMKAFVFDKLDEVHGLKTDIQLRQSVSALSFFLNDLPQLDKEDARRPRIDILVAEPWRRVKPKELVLACNTHSLLSALSSDSIPDESCAGLAVYRRLHEASALIIDETLANHEGGTESTLSRIEQVIKLNQDNSCIESHPVVLFRIKKTFLDKFDRDEHGEPILKTIEFKLRQVVHTTRDKDGILSEHIVTNELLDPVVVGGTEAKGQYGLHYYKTVLRVRPVEGDEDSTRVQFSILSVPDFRGRLARSRIRQAVAIFINFENRRVISQTLARVGKHWPMRVPFDDAGTMFVKASSAVDMGREDPECSATNCEARETE